MLAAVLWIDLEPGPKAKWARQRRLRCREGRWPRCSAPALAVILAVACASGSKGVAPAAVPTASSPLTGKFVWHDLITEDPEACRRFYGALLGWEFEDTHRADKPYIVARAGGHYVAGIVAGASGCDPGPVAVARRYVGAGRERGRG